MEYPSPCFIKRHRNSERGYIVSNVIGVIVNRSVSYSNALLGSIHTSHFGSSARVPPEFFSPMLHSAAKQRCHLPIFLSTRQPQGPRQHILRLVLTFANEAIAIDKGGISDGNHGTLRITLATRNSVSWCSHIGSGVEGTISLPFFKQLIFLSLTEPTTIAASLVAL